MTSKQKRGREHDIKQWNKMKEELKTKLIMESTEDVKFIEQLIHDVQITDFDTRWRVEGGPFTDEVMKKKIEDHYKRIGENVYNRISAAIKELENQRDAKRRRTERESIGGKKRRKSRRRKRTKKRRKSRRRKRRR